MLWSANHTIKTDRSLSRITNKPIGGVNDKSKIFEPKTPLTPRAYKPRHSLNSPHNRPASSRVPAEHWMLLPSREPTRKQTLRRAREVESPWRTQRSQELNFSNFIKTLLHQLSEESWSQSCTFIWLNRSNPEHNNRESVFSIIKLNRELNFCKKLAWPISITRGQPIAHFI